MMDTSSFRRIAVLSTGEAITSGAPIHLGRDTKGSEGKIMSNISDPKRKID